MIEDQNNLSNDNKTTMTPEEHQAMHTGKTSGYKNEHMDIPQEIYYAFGVVAILALFIGSIMFLSNRESGQLPNNTRIINELDETGINVDEAGEVRLNPGAVQGQQSQRPPQQQQTAQNNRGVITELRPSTTGEITMLNGPNANDEIVIYDKEYGLYGDLGLNGDLFTFDVFVNNKLATTYRVDVNTDGRRSVWYDGASSLSGDDPNHDYNKFYIKIDSLNSGKNNIKLALYADVNKTIVLDQMSFLVNQIERDDYAEVELEGAGEYVNKQNFYKSLGIRFEEEELWEYFPPRHEVVNAQDIGYDGLAGISSAFGEYDIKELGTVNVFGEDYPFYKITYLTYKGEVPQKTYYLGYVDDNVFRYFSNASGYPNLLDGMLRYYFEGAPVLLPNTVSELTKVNLDETDDYLESSQKQTLCISTDQQKGQLYDEDPYYINEDIKAVDEYGLCKEFNYVADYFAADNFGGYDYLDNIHNSEFVRLKLELEDEAGFDEDKYYSPFAYGCQSTREYRELESNLEAHLDQVGESITGDRIYIFKDDTPLMDDVGKYGLLEFEFGKAQSTLSDSEWKEILESQEEDGYPVFMAKNEFGEYFVLVREDRVFVPNC